MHVERLYFSGAPNSGGEICPPGGHRRWRSATDLICPLRDTGPVQQLSCGTVGNTTLQERNNMTALKLAATAAIMMAPVLFANAPAQALTARQSSLQGYGVFTSSSGAREAYRGRYTPQQDVFGTLGRLTAPGVDPRSDPYRSGESFGDE